MRSEVGKGILVVLFFAGILGLLYLGNHPALRHGQVVLGFDWVAWAAGFLCFVPCLAAVPWLVRLYGGAVALDESLITDLEQVTRRPRDTVATLPWFHRAVGWLTEIGVRGSLHATSLRRRYGHLALAPWPALAVVSTLAVRSVNGAFAAPSEEVQCTVIRTFRNGDHMDQVFTCRTAGGRDLGETETSWVLPTWFHASARHGGLGVWLLDPTTIVAN